MVHEKNILENKKRGNGISVASLVKKFLSL